MKTTIDDMQHRVERLKNYFARWGRHDRDCRAAGQCNVHTDCTCGLSAAITSEGAPFHIPAPANPDAEVAFLRAQRDQLRAALTSIVNGEIRVSDKSECFLSEHDPKVIAARVALAAAKE